MPLPLPLEAPCGILGPCARCTPWGFGVAFLAAEPQTARQVADAVEHYWSATYLTRVFHHLEGMGVLEIETASGPPRYAVHPVFTVAAVRGDLFEVIDARFAQWRASPDPR